MNNQRITLLLADDHEMMLDGLRAIFLDEEEIEVVRSVSDGEQLVHEALRFRPDVCIIDLDMPKKNGLEAAALILDENPNQKIILLTMHRETSILRKAKEAGIVGYLLKTCDREELVFAVRRVVKGKSYFSDSVFSEPPESNSPIPTGDIAKIQQLTRRETEVLRLLCDGHTNSRIAEMLFISPSTVDSHRTSIMRKLEVHNIAALIRFCLENKVI